MATDVIHPDVTALPRAGGATRYQRLVDKWIDLTTWSPARKTAAALALAAGFHIVIGLCAWSALRLSPGVVDNEKLAVVLAGWAGLCLLMMVLSLIPARSGHEGRWTPYMAIIGYGLYVAFVTALFGITNTAWTAIAPLVVLLVPIYWGLSAGRFAFVFLLFIWAMVSLLELSGTIPLAPLMQTRAIDATRTLGWHLGTYVLVCSVVCYLFLMVHFSVSVKERQQERLEVARRNLETASRHKSEFLANIRRHVRCAPRSRCARAS